MVFHEALVAYSDWGFLALRLALGAIFLYHGLPKVLQSRLVAKGMGSSQGFVFTLGLVEVLSSLAVLLGVYTYLGALGMIVVMLGALYMKIIKWKVPFSSMDKMGWEFDVVLLAGSLTLLLSSYGFILL